MFHNRFSKGSWFLEMVRSHWSEFHRAMKDAATADCEEVAELGRPRCHTLSSHSLLPGDFPEPLWGATPMPTYPCDLFGVIPGLWGWA